MIQFGRYIKVIVKTISQDLTFLGYTLGEKGFDISFDALLSDGESPNRCSISIYNLTQITRDACTQAKQVELYAGYSNSQGDGTCLIFIGEPIQISSYRENVTWVTQFYLQDSKILTSTNTLQKTYSKGVTIKSIYEDLANSMGIPVIFSPVIDAYINIKIMRSIPLSGKYGKCLKELKLMTRLCWSILHGSLYVGPYNGTTITGDATVFVISQKTGLLETPKISLETRTVQALASKEQLIQGAAPRIIEKLTYNDIVTLETELVQKTVQVRCLLNPFLKPGSVIKIEAPYSTVELDEQIKTPANINAQIEGNYVILQINQTGSNTVDSQFDSIISAISFDDSMIRVYTE